MTERVYLHPGMEPDRTWTAPAGPTRRHRCRVEHTGVHHVCICNCGRGRDGKMLDPTTGT